MILGGYRLLLWGPVCLFCQVLQLTGARRVSPWCGAGCIVDCSGSFILLHVVGTLLSRTRVDFNCSCAKGYGFSFDSWSDLFSLWPPLLLSLPVFSQLAVLYLCLKLVLFCQTANISLFCTAVNLAFVGVHIIFSYGSG